MGVEKIRGTGLEPYFSISLKCLSVNQKRCPVPAKKSCTHVTTTPRLSTHPQALPVYVDIQRSFFSVSSTTAACEMQTLNIGSLSTKILISMNKFETVSFSPGTDVLSRQLSTNMQSNDIDFFGDTFYLPCCQL